jgi:hypothetical protein
MSDGTMTPPANGLPHHVIPERSQGSAFSLRATPGHQQIPRPLQDLEMTVHAVSPEGFLAG